MTGRSQWYRWISVVAAAGILAVPAAVSAHGSPPTPPPPTPVTSNPTTSTTVPPPGPPIVTLPTTPLPCDLGPADPDGTITFVANGQLLSVRPDGTALSCQFSVDPEVVGRIAWSSGADRVLLGPNIVGDGDGTRDSGYFADNTKVSWSTPTGEALIAPKASTGELIWRSSSDAGDRLDISFLQRTDYAAYHPSGRAIAATGVGPTGVTGVYLASNRGEGVTSMARLETPASELTEVGFSATGANLYFVHHHLDTGLSHIHRQVADTLELSDVSEAPGLAGDLTISTVDEDVLAWQNVQVGEPAQTVVSVIGGAPIAVDLGLADVDVEPVGWLPGARLVVRSVPTGSAPGTPGDVWVWSADGPPVHVVSGVAQAAVRVMQSQDFVDPPLGLAIEAPG